MKKNGFTLVELLAVIAILAILVIIALPNVMGMFNEAKKNSFTTEVKEIFKVAEQKWISDSMFNTKERVYSRCDTCIDESLELTGRQELKYCIKINKAGYVTEYKATDGTYQYSYSGDGLKVEEIGNVAQISNIDESDVIEIDCKSNNTRIAYVTKNSHLIIGESINDFDVYSTYQQAINATGYDFFIKAIVENDIVKELYVGFLLNGNVYYLQGGVSEKYGENKNLLLSIFNPSSCTSDDTSVKCTIPSNQYEILADNTGRVYAKKSWYCVIHQNGESLCFDD